jgi:hypothetical protein
MEGMIVLIWILQKQVLRTVKFARLKRRRQRFCINNIKEVVEQAAELSAN